MHELTAWCVFSTGVFPYRLGLSPESLACDPVPALPAHHLGQERDEPQTQKRVCATRSEVTRCGSYDCADRLVILR